MSGRWNSNPAIAGGGVLIDNGTHAVDIVRYLVGPIERVSAMRGVSRTLMEVEDTGVLLAETADRVVATVMVSWSIAPNNPSYVTVHGTDGTIDVGWSGSWLRSQTRGEIIEFGEGYAKLDALRANVEDFARARNGGRLRLSMADVLASVAVVTAAYDAIDSRTWIDVAEIAVTGDSAAATAVEPAFDRRHAYRAG